MRPEAALLVGPTTRVALVCRNLLPGLDPIQAVNFLFRFFAPLFFTPTIQKRRANCKI